MSSNPSSERSTSVLGKRTRSNGQDGRFSRDASESSSPGYIDGISADNAAGATVGSSSNPGSFVCTYEGCPKAFATTAHRKRHERSHTGILPYACPLCGKRFARSDVRGRHITGIHEKDPAQVLKGFEPRQAGKHAVPPQPSSIWSDSGMAIGMGHHDGAASGRHRPSVPGTVEPYLTNNRIISQILQPASLPSPEPGSNSFDSTLTDGRVLGQDTFQSPAFGTSGHFPQPSISHLAAPSQHPNMEMLLQAVSTSHWTDAMQGNQTFPSAPPPQAPSIDLAQPPQISTGFISLDLPTSAASGDLAGGEMADVFGWGVNNADWTKLYDSIGMDADTAMDATTMLPLDLPDSYSTADHSAFLRHDTSGSRIWTTTQQPSPLRMEMSGAQRSPCDQRQPNSGPHIGYSSKPRGSYILPSELPDQQEVYPSRTSRINRDMTYVSQMHAPPTEASYSANTKASQTNHQSGQQGVPWPKPAPIPVKKALALPNPVNQTLPPSEFPAYVGSRHHAALLRLIDLTHEPTFPPPDLANFPDPAVMSVCVGLYFEHFHPILPVLRPAAFQDLDRLNQEIVGASGINGNTTTVASNIVEYQNHPYYPFLLLTMCAIGANYAKRDWKPVAIYMNELARRAGKHLRDRDSRAVFSKQYMQARLLQAVAGLAIGSRDLYLESEMTRSVLVAAGRRANLLRSMKASTQNTPPHAFSPLRSGASGTGHSSEAPGGAVHEESDEELEARWYRWLEEEERRRLGWGIYIVDSQGASVLNVPASFALDEIHAAMPSTKELWIAPTAAAWDAAVKRAHLSDPDSTEAQAFNRVLRDALQEGLLPRTVSDFGKNIIAHTLHRICNEASALNKLLVGDSLITLEELRKSSFPPNLQHDPYALLEKLAISWHDSVEYPSYFLISNDALRHHACLKLIHPQFLDHVKYAAGQWEWDASKSTARQWLRVWLAENPESSRRIIVHCAQMAALLSRFSKDTCWEPVWTLDCCLAWWAVMKFGNADCLHQTLTEKTADRRLLIKWSDPPDRVERWIATGAR